MTALTLHRIEARYDPKVPVVQGLDLDVRSGELFVLLGPSGSGKTSVLRVIAGLLSPAAGEVAFDGESVLATPPEQRQVCMVFQEPALVPFRTVAQNVEFGLKLRKVDRNERRTRVAAALAEVRLDGFGDRWPAELSGGQRQRVSLARALVVRPRLLLLDEPLSSLDQGLRQELGTMIGDLQRASGITTVMVTHDQHEAAAMADRVGVMIDGVLRQVGTYDDLRADPCDAAVADFLQVRAERSG